MPFVPFSFEKRAYKWLANALDIGIDECTYWNMTIAELTRAIESHNRREKAQQREQASFDYLLADTIGKSVARIYSSSARMPEIYDVYPTLFDSAEIQAQKKAKKDELSVLRFKQFAQAHNDKYKGASKKDE